MTCLTIVVGQVDSTGQPVHGAAFPRGNLPSGQHALNAKELHPNGTELPETLKVRGEGQMARTSIVCFLAGP